MTSCLYVLLLHRCMRVLCATAPGLVLCGRLLCGPWSGQGHLMSSTQHWLSRRWQQDCRWVGSGGMSAAIVKHVLGPAAVILFRVACGVLTSLRLGMLATVYAGRRPATSPCVCRLSQLTIRWLVSIGGFCVQRHFWLSCSSCHLHMAWSSKDHAMCGDLHCWWQ